MENIWPEIPEIWKGEDAWIIGGGASLLEQFAVPKEIVRKVRTYQLPLTALTPYLSLLKEVNVIGVNIAFQLGDFVNVACFGDKTFGLKWEAQLMDFPGMVITCNDLPNRNKKFIRVLKEREKIHGLSPKKNTICWNNSSGGAAIDLAAHFGVSRIFLLGFDMTLDSERHQHWHNVYRREKEEKAKRYTPFRMHLKPFAQIAKDAKLRDISVYNVNPYSNITDFEKIDLRGAMSLINRKNGWDNNSNGRKATTVKTL